MQQALPCVNSLSPSQLIQIAQQRKLQDQQSKWKSKSLNSLPLQDYFIDLPKISNENNGKLKKSNTKQPQQNKSNQGNKLISQPKIKKINQKMFCITLGNQINVFYHLDNNQKARMKPPKRNFRSLKYQLNQNIQFASVNGTNLIFVGSKNQLYILQMQKKKNQDGYNIKLINKKQIDSLKAVTFINRQIIVLSSDQVYQFSMNGNFDLISKKVIQFKNQQDRKLFNQLKSIGIVVESFFTFHFFGTLNQMRQDHKQKRKIISDEKIDFKQCQILHLVKFKIDIKFLNPQIVSNRKLDDLPSKFNKLSSSNILDSKINAIQTDIYAIDHVFDTGIFSKSKIFKINQNVFLMSLHQEVILIKYHFNKFIVWDNVSIVSSKSQQKKGQLILADKRVLVYSQNCQIFAHDIYFNQIQSRIKMPPIDSFKGNQKDGQILFDAVLLQYDQNSLMKVLFYFKQDFMSNPNKQNQKKNKSGINNSNEEPKLQFSLLCISQSDPKQKLTQMLKAKKPPNQINEFCLRFGINSLEKTKCMWSVCDKTQKDIGNVLLQISDDNYIQTQLDNILKQRPHGLSFLLQIQKKQITRFTKTIVNNLFNDSQANVIHTKTQDQEQKIMIYSVSDKQREQKVKNAIQSLMQSIMFKKKLKYSTKFLSFKEYDFIQIGKLKAASLKEEIKLLSCKKYQQRLIYFLNTFKIQVIANYDEIFKFLLLNKNLVQIEDFIKNFSFILPKFAQSSSSFLEKDGFQLHPITRKIGDKNKNDENDWKNKNQDQNSVCKLWQDSTQNTNQQEKQLNTLDQFKTQIIQAIKTAKKDRLIEQKALQNFERLLQQVINGDWFRKAAFKQHSMLIKNSTQLQEEFIELKTKKAYQILIKFLYEQLQNGNQYFKAQNINRMLESFVSQKLIPMSFKKNDDARLQVYKILVSYRKISRQSSFSKKSSYLVLSQQEYFSFLFRQVRPLILTKIKDQYTRYDKDFFRERFKIYLKSSYVELTQMIDFLDAFKMDNQRQNQISGRDDQNDDIREDIFNCIIRLLKLGDKQNAQKFINKIMQYQQDNETLKQQAKVPNGYVFYDFFRAFNLDYTYKQLIQATKNSNLSSNKFLTSLIQQYCQQKYDIVYDGVSNSCIISFIYHRIYNQKLNDVDIYNKPLQFFGILLCMIDLLQFQVQQISIYHLMIQNYLNQGKNMIINNYVHSISNQIQQQQGNNNVSYDSKFNQLFDFVKHLDNYDLNQGKNSGQKNYQLLSDFKEQCPQVEHKFVQYTVQWINKNYSSIKSTQQIEPILLTIKKVIETLKRSNKNSRKIKQVDAFYRLLELLKSFNIQLMKKIDFIKQQMQNSGFIFMIHMFKQAGLNNFIKSKMQRNNGPNYKQRQIENQLQSEIKIDSSWETNIKIYNWMSIFSQLKIIKNQENIDQRQNPQFIRFVIEICDLMISQEQYEIAWDLMIRSINQNYYWKDIFYYLVSSMIIQNQEEFKKQFKVFLSTQTPKNIKLKLDAMIKGHKDNSYSYRVLSYPQKMLKYQNTNEISKLTYTTNPKDLNIANTFLKDNKKQIQIMQNMSNKQEHQKQKLKKNAIFIFQQLLESNRPDQAFYFLIRVKKIKHIDIKKIIQKSKRLSKQLYRYSYLLLTSYVKCLQAYISNEFYPTFMFFKSKYQILIDQTQKIDIIKDINIAISRLKIRAEQQQKQVLKKYLSQAHAQLYQYYVKYMKVLKQNPVIKLTQEDQLQASKRIKGYANMITPLYFEQEQKSQQQAKRKIMQNHDNIQKIHQNNKLNVIHREISESVNQAKRAADKYTAILDQKKKQERKITYAQRKEKQLFQIRKKQSEDISSIKQSYKSNTTQRVEDLLENLRKKRQKINQNKMKNSTMRQINTPAININVPSKDNYSNNYKKEQQTLNRLNGQINIPILSRTNERSQTLTTNIGDNNTRFNIEQNRQSQKYTQIKNKIKKYDQPTAMKVKISLQQINQLFKTKQSQAHKYLEKFDLIKQNMQVGVQLVKRVYSVIKDLSNFLQFLRYLLGYDQRYKTVLEQKSIAIVSQMIKMDQKINLKDLIPAELFTSVQNLTLKDYYYYAYELMRNNIKKVLAQPDIAPHAVGILIRFSLGSQTKYYHRVFADYISVLLKNYQLKIIDEKQTLLLAQKLRSQFTNLDSENRQTIFEKLINQVNNQPKRKRLIDALRKTLQRKTDSTINSTQFEEFNRALLRLSSK